MYQFVVTHRDNPSAQYLLHEYPLTKWKTLCPCALYPPYKATRADSTSKHNVAYADSTDGLCLSCLRFEGKWTALAQQEYETYYAPLYTQGEREIYRLWRIEADFYTSIDPDREAFYRPWLEESVQKWMEESVGARSTLTDQQRKNLRKRENRREKQLQLMEQENQASAPSSQEGLRRNTGKGEV